MGAAFSRRLRRGRPQVPRQPAVAAAAAAVAGRGLVAGGGGGAEGAAGLEAAGGGAGEPRPSVSVFFYSFKKTLPSVRFNTR